MKESKILLGLVYLLMLVACQGTPPPAPVVEAPKVAAEVVPAPVETPAPMVAEIVASLPDSLQATRDGFSPRAAVPANTLELKIQWGAPEKVVEWAVRFVPEAGGEAVRTLRGTQTVPSVTWDGLDDSGLEPPQGRYIAVLQTAGADAVLINQDTTEPFVLDLVPPSGTISISPLPFLPGPAEAIVTPSAELIIELSIISGGAPWTTWRLGVIHPDGRRFRDFINEEHRDDRIVWNGRALNNAQLEAGTTYNLVAEVFDVYGNKGILTAELPVQAAPEPVVEVVQTPQPQAMPVVVTLDGKLLAEFVAYFAPYSSVLEANQEAILMLVELLKSAPGTAITIVGHANQVLYQDPVKAAYEQAETLVPLSLARAAAVRQALVQAGIAEGTLGVAGMGASEPVAAFSDAANRWKNRRVGVEMNSQ